MLMVSEEKGKTWNIYKSTASVWIEEAKVTGSLIDMVTLTGRDDIYLLNI